MLKRFLNAAQSNPQIASGFKQKLGITSPTAPQSQNSMRGQSAFSAPRPPVGMATRPPVIANKARGTIASTVRNLIPRLRF